MAWHSSGWAHQTQTALQRSTGNHDIGTRYIRGARDGAPPQHFFLYLRIQAWDRCQASANDVRGYARGLQFITQSVNRLRVYR